MQNSNNKLKQKRIIWIDMARGIAMLSILLFHTDSYNFDELIIPYEFYVENFLALFFFISGFFFYKSDKDFNVSHKLKSIAKTIILPYFIFTSVMSLPKAYVHGDDISYDLLTDILYGQASWFVTALVAAELLFTLLIVISRNNKLIMPVTCIACGIISVYAETSLNLWHFQNALLAMPYIYMGFIYHKHENKIYGILKNKWFVIMSLLFLVCAKYLEHTANLKMLFEPVMITYYLLFFIDTVLFISVCIVCIKHIKTSKIICWTGRNTLVYYFLCGGVPLLTNKIIMFAGIDYGQNILSLLVITFIVYCITTAITYVIARYIPFITGKF